jgi:glycosyltransferase involved in cell wall biosynthesis
MKLSLVIPCLNEEKNIEPLAKKIQKAFSKKFTYEVIWVDDGSTDKTPVVMKKIAKKYPQHKTVILMRCVGQSTALMAGFDTAQGDYIATMDGDIQNDPDEIPEMLKKLEKEKLDMVVGWREKRWKNNVSRRIPSLIANYIIRKSFRHIDVHDAGCPVKVCKAHILKDIRIYGELHRFLTYVVGDLGARIGEVKIYHRKRRNGHSKYGIGRTLTVLMDIINLKFLTMRKTTPIRIMGPIAIVLYFLGIVTFVWMIYEKFANNVGMSNTPLLVLSVMFALMATMFLVMGLLAELVIRSYFEGSNKKSYFVREVVVK